MTSPAEYRPSTGDRIGIVVFMAAGAAIVAWSAIAAVMRVVHVLLGEDIPATANFRGLEVEAPIGPGGAMLPVRIDTATVTVSQLSPAGFGAAIIAQVILFGTVATVVVCLMLLARNSLRGRIFGRGSTRLVTAAGMTALLGFGLAPVFEGMVANDAIARLSQGDFDDYAILTVEPLPFVLLAFAFSIAATAYTIGARIQRDAEGLV